MTVRLHLPHPHIADRFIEHIGEGFFAGIFHHQPISDRAIAPAEDWNDWHHADADAWMEAEIHGGEQ